LIGSIGSWAPTPIPLPQLNVSSDATVESILEDSSTHPTLKDPPVLFIKDKPANLSIKEITDKASWIEAKKVIDAHLRCSPYLPSPTLKALITMPENQVNSSWWMEILYFYIKSPISNLFIKNPAFDGKVFEMIDHFEKYFNLLGAIDFLSYIFQLISIKQKGYEEVSSLKARLLRLFASLKMGGINIDSVVQVGFMLQALLSQYHGGKRLFCSAGSLFCYLS
jgi:hypothetical protein